MDEAGSTIITGIAVANGTYYPDEDTDRTETFALTDGLALYGGFAGTENVFDFDIGTRNFDTNETILDGDIDDNNGTLDDGNSFHVVTGADYAILDGFTVTGGNANGSGDNQYGGGVLNIQASPNISNCIIKGNYADYGGGIYNYGIITDLSLTNVINCLFIENEAIDGGAVYNKNYSWDLIINCIFSKNEASNLGGAVYDYYSYETDIVNSILWGDTDSTASDYEIISNGTLGEDPTWIEISYSDVGNMGTANGGTINPGSGTLSTDPLFADAAGGDFHLKSAETDGRWDPTANGGNGGWVTDSVTSPCIDGGDLTSSYANEPAPNGSNINMGVYGNTAEASKSYYAWLTVNITPTAAVNAGGMWAIEGYDTVWRLSGTTAHVPPDDYTIIFRYVGADPKIIDVSASTDWWVPESVSQTLVARETVSLNATYKAITWVDKNNTTSPWDGSQENPYQTITSGINNVPSGDVVYVQTGTYYENLSFDSGDDFSLMGNSYPIIDGEYGGRVISVDNTANTIVIDGFYIAQGYHIVLGGGMYIENSSPIITNCIFLYNWVGYFDPSGYVNGGMGGGLYIDGGSPTISYCTFYANTVDGVDHDPGTWPQTSIPNYFVFNRGGAIATNNSSATFSYCTIGDTNSYYYNLATGNTVDSWASHEVYTKGSTVPTYDHCSILGGFNGSRMDHETTAPIDGGNNSAL